MIRYIFSIVFTVLSLCLHAQHLKWTEDQANSWYKQQTWPRGCNYQPSTAINQLEMFQRDSYDPKTIDKELGWAQDLGFNTMRVYLHHILWTSDKEGFKTRLNDYLRISDKHGIKTILVFFDDCWNDTYAPGKQPEPKPGIHNSGWVRDPGTMIYSHPDSLKVLEAYVKDIMHSFKDDKRILAWDLYNEPGNNKNFEKSLPLLNAVFTWARSVNISQPVTSAIWNNGEKFKELNKFQLENSDIITYHNYSYTDNHINEIKKLKKYNRPLICSEYMARRNGSLFINIMPVLKRENIGAINWGFVSGKTNTIYAWDTPMPTGREPELWFHDILRKNGTPFSETEIHTIKQLTGKE
jgi:hypothetical protein